MAQPPDETKRERKQRRLTALKQERRSFEPHWRELSEYFSPRRGRWLQANANGQVNDGQKRHQKLVRGTPRYAARTLASGMMAGLTSPARPWFRLATPDPEMMEYGPVKEWLAAVELRMRDRFARSNLYNVLPTVYSELGVYGTAAMSALEDDEDLIRFYPYTVGSYWIANSHRLSVDTFYREFPMTVRQVVDQFIRRPNGALDWANASLSLRSMWEGRNLEAWVNIVHAIEPNLERVHGRMDYQGMPVASCYYEADSTEPKMLRESGFREFPMMVPRWELTAEEYYGSSPAMDALGDAKELQHKVKQKAKLVDKSAEPPMTGPTSLRTARASLLPGDITYVDVTTGQQGFQPAMTVAPQAIVAVREDVAELDQLISRGMYEDLFLMLAQSDRREITAREIEERHEEKLLALGPVLERLNDELLDPLIDRTFAVMLRAGEIPEAPEELADVDLKVEYISILAQAQRAVEVGGIERFSGFVTSLAAVQPEVLDKVDLDQTVDNYAEALGISPKLVVPDERVEEIRKGRQQQQQAAAMAQAAQVAAPAAAAAKDLSETKVGGASALDLITGRAPAAGSP